MSEFGAYDISRYDYAGYGQSTGKVRRSAFPFLIFLWEEMGSLLVLPSALLH